MIFVIQPLFVVPSFGWQVINKDQHRRPATMTAGITTPKKSIGQEWLSPLRAAVPSKDTVFPRVHPPPATAPLLSVVTWIQGRLTLYDRAERLIPLALVEAL